MCNGGGNRSSLCRISSSRMRESYNQHRVFIDPALCLSSTDFFQLSLRSWNLTCLLYGRVDAEERRGGAGLGWEGRGRDGWSVVAGGGVNKTVGSQREGGGGSWGGLSHDLNSPIWTRLSLIFFCFETHTLQYHLINKGNLKNNNNRNTSTFLMPLY